MNFPEKLYQCDDEVLRYTKTSDMHKKIPNYNFRNRGLNHLCLN